MQWLSNRCLSEFSTFGIGGPIRYFSQIKTVEEMELAFHKIRMQRLPFLIVGKGSNCLFPDEGFDGVVLLNCIDHLIWNGGQVHVGAGASFSFLGIQSAKKGLGGLEFASGIPASVGGAIFMNAGANGQQVKDVLQSVTFLDDQGMKKTIAVKDAGLGYRTSCFQTLQGAIISAVFQLYPFPYARQRQLEMIERRMQTQPLNEKSIGCIFQNPNGQKSAGALIEQCGLKGVCVGDAAVSEKHANFIVNRGHAASSDVLKLIRLIQSTVYQAERIQLKTEIRIVNPCQIAGFL